MTTNRTARIEAEYARYWAACDRLRSLGASDRDIAEESATHYANLEDLRG